MVKISAENGLHQAAFAFKVVIHGRFADPSRVANFERAGGFVPKGGKKRQSSFKDSLAVIHKSKYTVRYSACQERNRARDKLVL